MFTPSPLPHASNLPSRDRAKLLEVAPVRSCRAADSDKSGTQRAPVLHISPPTLVYIIHLIRTMCMPSSSLLSLNWPVPRCLPHRVPVAQLISDSRVSAGLACVARVRDQRQGKPDRRSESSVRFQSRQAEVGLSGWAAVFGVVPVQLWAGCAVNAPSRTLASAAAAGLSSCFASASQILRASAFLLAAMYAFPARAR